MPKCFQGRGSAHSRQNPFSGPHILGPEDREEVGERGKAGIKESGLKKKTGGVGGRGDSWRFT